MIYILLIFLFLTISAFSKATMDNLKFHFEKSIYSKLKEAFWNPAISHLNKYKNLDSKQGEAFLGSSTVFVSFTDAWHLFQHFFLDGIFVCIGMYKYAYPHMTGYIIIDIAIFIIFFKVAFEVFYKYILIRKNK